MHRHVAHAGSKKVQAGADRILPMLATRYNMAHFFRSGAPNDLLQFRQARGVPDQNDFIHALRAFESTERMGNDRLAPSGAKSLSKPIRRLLPAATMMALSIGEKVRTLNAEHRTPNIEYREFGVRRSTFDVRRSLHPNCRCTS